MERVRSGFGANPNPNPNPLARRGRCTELPLRRSHGAGWWTERVWPDPTCPSPAPATCSNRTPRLPRPHRPSRPSQNRDANARWALKAAPRPGKRHRRVQLGTRSGLGNISTHGYRGGSVVGPGSVRSVLLAIVGGTTAQRLTTTQARPLQRTWPRAGLCPSSYIDCIHVRPRIPAPVALGPGCVARGARTKWWGYVNNEQQRA